METHRGHWGHQQRATDQSRYFAPAARAAPAAGPRTRSRPAATLPRDRAARAGAAAETCGALRSSHAQDSEPDGASGNLEAATPAGRKVKIYKELFQKYHQQRQAIDVPLAPRFSAPYPPSASKTGHPFRLLSRRTQRPGRTGVKPGLPAAPAARHRRASLSTRGTSMARPQVKLFDLRPGDGVQAPRATRGRAGGQVPDRSRERPKTPHRVSRSRKPGQG